MFLWLEPSVVEVSSPHDNGVFHPKVWLLRFLADSGAVRYRFLCLTRNLTFDRSWDTVLCLEGDLPNRTNAYSRNRPLADFVSALAKGELKPKNLGTQNKDRIDRIADEILKVDFKSPDGFSGNHGIQVLADRNQQASIPGRGPFQNAYRVIEDAVRRLQSICSLARQRIPCGFAVCHEWFCSGVDRQ